MEVYDFLPTYIDFDDSESILGPDLIDHTSLYYKKEFSEYALKPNENKPEKAGQYMNHQIIISRFLSSYTPYKGLLVMHEPGTGKTCLSISVIEKILSESSAFRGALILMKGKNLVNNYKRELVHVCTDGKYDLDEDDDMTDNKKKRRINKKLSEFYKFQTFETFSKRISTMSSEDIRKQYNNLIIVIDEAHHLRINQTENTEEQKELKGQYLNIHRFLKTIQNSKTILMTGTPMIDNVSEIASLMNLILDEELPTGEDFLKEYMLKVGNSYQLRPDKIEFLKNKLHGKASFLRSMKSMVSREYEGKKLDLQYFNQYVVEMKDKQLESYKLSVDEDDVKGGVYINSRESNLFIYPDGSWGKKGFEKYVNTANQKFVLKSSFLKELGFDKKNNDDKLKILEKYSIKFAECIRIILANKNKKHFIYLDIVQGSGAIIFSLILEQFGIISFKSNTQSIKYALLTSKTSSDINKAIESYNDYKSCLKVIIGTKIISEGFSLKNVEFVHVLTPHWNFSETDQAIARAFRLFSHSQIEQVKKNLVVKIYLYTCFIKDYALDKSIDRYMYKICEDKDLSIKSIEYLLKQVSFDCRLNKNRNVLNKEFDLTRECEYQKCNYSCYKDEVECKEDYSTFNLFYNENEISVIIEEIKKLFKYKIMYKLNDLKKILKDHSEYSILKSIFYIIHQKISLYRDNGLYFYLYYIGDVLFLSPSIQHGNLFDSFYVTHTPLQFEFELKNKTNSLFVQTFEKLASETDKKRKKVILSLFTKEIQEMLLEYCILSIEKKIENINPIREFIVDQFNSFITKKGTMIISTLGKARCFDKEEWKDCEEKEVKEDKEGKEDKEDKEDKEVIKGDYLFTTDKGNFKIKKNVIKGDKRHDNRNIVCTSMDKERLSLLILELNIDLLDKNSLLYLSPNNDLYKNTKEQLVSQIKIKNSETFDKNELVKIVHLMNFTKKDLCNEIKFFTQK